MEKVCVFCGKQIPQDVNFCPVCGGDQRSTMVSQPRESPLFLTLLCVLSILGSIFTIARAYFYEMVSIHTGDSDYYRGWVYAGTAIGTMVGAIMMIQRKINGLYIYTIFQLIYIFTVLIASLSYMTNTITPNLDPLAIGVAMLFIIPSMLFLILYWTSIARKYLDYNVLQFVPPTISA